MTFKELAKEDYSFRLYQYLKSFLALHNQKPLKILRIDNRLKTRIIIIKQSQNAQRTIDTKTVIVNIEDAPFVISWLSRDFENLEIEQIESEVI